MNKPVMAAQKKPPKNLGFFEDSDDDNKSKQSSFIQPPAPQYQPAPP